METVGQRVAHNVAALRDQRGMSVRALSARLAELGRPLLPSGVTKVEQGARRVDVDDLLALAVALGVNPSRLLLGPESEDEPVAVTPVKTVPAWAAWQWLDGYRPLPTRPGDDPEHPYNTPDEVDEFHYRSRPGSIRREEQHPLTRTARDLYFTARRVVHHATKTPDRKRKRPDLGLDTTLTTARRNLDRVARELDALENGADHGQR